MSDLYYKALAADEAFQEALVKEYGKDAGTKRYAPDHTYPEYLQVLSKKFKQEIEESFL